jgi:hypothetical protein
MADQAALPPGEEKYTFDAFGRANRATPLTQTPIWIEATSKALADNGVEKWTFDTEKLTITYLDKAGNVLLSEKVE